MTVTPEVDRVPGAVLGRPLLRFEDGPLLRGAASFFDDIVLPRMLHAAFLRSPLAHASITGIDASAAKAVPGVAAIVTASELDLPPLVCLCETPGAYAPPRPLLAADVVRFVGEPIAVVVAESRYVAEDALDLVELDLDLLEVVADPWRALEDDAPRLHRGASNVYADLRSESGDVEAEFRRAPVVVEAELMHGRCAAVPIEPRGLIAAPDGPGVVVWATTQGPHKLRIAIAATLGLAEGHVRVVCASVGGGFGQKAHVSPEEIVVAALAHRLGRPVKWTEDRTENLLASSHARDQRLRIRAAADLDGRLLALDVVQLVDQGAYGTFPHGTTLEVLTTPALLPGPYRLRAFRVHARAAATNKCPQGAYRGVGFAAAAFAHERIVDLVAAELGLDRAEIRRRNLLTAEEIPFVSLTGQRYDSGDFHATLERALELIGYDGFEDERRAARLEGRLVGLGISCYVEPTGMNSAVFKGRGMVGVEGFDSAYVVLGADGGATVWTTTPTVGQGTDTTFAQLVADGLSLEPEAVRVAPSDTGVGGLAGMGTFASRSAVSAGGAVSRACAELERRLIEDAAERLGVAVGELVLADGEVRAASAPGRAVPIGELVAAGKAGRYEVGATWDPPAVAYPYGTHACVVEIDAETGRVDLLRYAIADDCGRVINPLIVAGQVHGATAQGIAEALFEAVDYDGEGQLRNASLMDMLVPTAAELPEFAVAHVEIPSPATANGVKGVGEGGTIGAAGAVANAVCDALGHQLNELPVRPARVRELACGLLAGGI